MKTKQMWLIVTIIFVPVFLGVIFSLLSDRVPESSKFSTVTSKKIGLVDINDIIYSSQPYIEQLRRLREDKSIVGIILRIDSPGGLVAPSQEIYRELMCFRQENKPVVVSMGNVAASGGYYIASPAKKIFANPGTITGSIGVIFKIPHYYKLMQKIGIEVTTITSGKYKDVGTPYRPLSGEEKDLIQNIIDDTHRQFIADVAAARGISVDSVKAFANGRIFTGAQAVQLRLVDTTGSYEDALNYLKTLLGLGEKTKVIQKKERPMWFEEFIVNRIFRIAMFFRVYFAPMGAYYLFE